MTVIRVLEVQELLAKYVQDQVLRGRDARDLVMDSDASVREVLELIMKACKVQDQIYMGLQPFRGT